MSITLQTPKNIRLDGWIEYGVYLSTRLPVNHSDELNNVKRLAFRILNPSNILRWFCTQYTELYTVLLGLGYAIKWFLKLAYQTSLKCLLYWVLTGDIKILIARWGLSMLDLKRPKMPKNLNLAEIFCEVNTLQTSSNFYNRLLELDKLH